MRFAWECARLVGAHKHWYRQPTLWFNWPWEGPCPTPPASLRLSSWDRRCCHGNHRPTSPTLVDPDWPVCPAYSHHPIRCPSHDGDAHFDENCDERDGAEDWKQQQQSSHQHHKTARKERMVKECTQNNYPYKYMCAWKEKKIISWLYICTYSGLILICKQYIRSWAVI